VGGLIALALMLVLFAEDADTGKTLIGLDPAFGLDASAREGTRAVGPLTAVWFAVFMVPFFLWVREPAPVKAPKGALSLALRDLGGTLTRLPQSPSLFAYLGSSMLYRDALNGMYALGGIYASGVMGWSITQIGVFGITSIIAGAAFAVIGGWADARFGPRPVITFCVLVLMAVAVGVALTTPTMALGLPVGAASALPDVAFMFLGACIGAAGGALQAASRSMMVRQANPHRMNEAFGLYALAGKATSFLAPALISAVTYGTGSQQLGVLPIVVLFLIGLVLLRWVNPNGDPNAWTTDSA
ncbi:MAG: MFS transporter, partial [Paracoccaceae bacterium]